MGTQRFFCHVDRHEDITAQVHEALEDKGSVVFRLQSLVSTKRNRKFFVWCSDGHLNVIELE